MKANRLLPCPLPPKKTVFLRIIFSTFLFFISFASAQAGESLGGPDNPVRMLFVPSGEAQVILEGGEEIAALLERETGLSIEASVATSYAAVIEAMGAGKGDIGWLPPFSYVLAREKYDVELLYIVAHFGRPFYRGQILVRSDSDIQTLGDLEGKSFAFVDPASTSGHLYPKTLLLKKGFNPEKFFKQSRFAGSHNAVVLSVMKGEVDAGATYEGARAAVAKSFPDVYTKLRVIAYTPQIPNDTICARKGLDKNLKEKIRAGLLTISKSPEGAKLMKKAYGISGLIDLDGMFDSVREARRWLKQQDGK
ncbi:MAG: phosphate/phosphite/phosphonate ABC transporter substrate-binding protein [Candidatus Nitronauta litoralis]|uniref:Phosphate/phosphite/phosphonate ABC transporter substrate-binding protein n=1 Tax=Candidatus Nitronauta litoralis TaxID=2705533 RepID=A0A7T0BUB9_9BACT|nr:MAG: phosphate/phosphite/phosphonate ABC transporter substrate-binding protein [Candidatus Nitronauta litoralis]